MVEKKRIIRAFAKSIHHDWEQLEALDGELTQSADDLDASEVRVELLFQTRSFGSVPLRIISIMEQAVSTKRARRVFGHFYPLIDLPSDADLDLLLDNASRTLQTESKVPYEFQSIYKRWLERRLDNFTTLTPAQLTAWLRSLRDAGAGDSKKIMASLTARFAQEPSLFGEVFDLLANTVPNEERSFYLFVVMDLWELLPVAVWPVPPCEFFLAYAEKEKDLERAADFFRMYLSWFPLEGAPVALMEAGFDLLDRRDDLAKALGNWRSCKIEKWRKNQWKSHEKQSRKDSVVRAQNIADFTPHLKAIREGGEERALAWAAMVYQGLFYDVKDAPGGRERLISLMSDEIADAFIEGFIRYMENPDIPKKEVVIESYLANSIPYTHHLLSLSVFLRLNKGMDVPEVALPHCLAAVVTDYSGSDSVPGYKETLSTWLLHEVRQNPDVVKSVLHDLWVACVKKKNGNLPIFYELSHDPDSQQFLASLSAGVLKTKINEDPNTVGELVSVLLHYDQRTALAIGKTEFARKKLSAAVRDIWATVLFVIDPIKYLEPWKTLMSEPDAVLWGVIKVIEGSRYTEQGAVSLTSAQRMEIVKVMGEQFVNVGHPSEGWSGSQNPWDAAQFVANQIKLLAADCSAEVGGHLARLEHDGGLASYRDLIRHHRAQYEKQQRELSFTFASPGRVAQAIKNQVPATSNDLLALIVDHLGILSSELPRTQRERYRAYWNHDGRNLIKPKYEEVCSGFLAEDLQNRLQALGLIVSVEHHMIDDKECDLVVSQGIERLLPIEVKHHYNPELWTAWDTQLDRLYTRDAKAGGLGIYLVLWSGEAKGRKMPKLPDGIIRPSNATELSGALESLIPKGDRQRLRVVVVDISGP